MKEKILNFLFLLSFIFLLYAIVSFIFSDEMKRVDDSFSKYFQQGQKTENKKEFSKEKKKKINFDKALSENKMPKDIINVSVNPPLPFSYKSKNEIFDIRKEYVMASPFAYEGYEPAEHVFGSIEDGLPWVSNYLCSYKETHTANIEGPSEEARFLNNPTALIMLEHASSKYWCHNVPETYKGEIMPIEITYSPDKKTVYVRYPRLPKRKRVPYSMNGLNARDLGYNYIFIDLNQSNFVPDFETETNAGNKIVELFNLIHRGSACGHETGCNNGSPDQPELNFYNKPSKKDVQFLKRLHIKLWKEMPNSPNDEADMTEIISIDY